jgi:hypothetical protein
MDPKDAGEGVGTSVRGAGAARDEGCVEAEVRRRQRLAQEAYARAHGFVIIGGVPYVSLGDASEIGSSVPIRKGI